MYKEIKIRISIQIGGMFLENKIKIPIRIEGMYATRKGESMACLFRSRIVDLIFSRGRDGV